MLHLNPARFRHLMRRNGWTISRLAKTAGVTQERVRELRDRGINFRTNPSASTRYLDVCAWLEFLTGRSVFNRDFYDRLCR